LLVEALAPLAVRLPNGTITRLAPGIPVDFPDEQAKRLLDRAGGKVRAVGLGPKSLAGYVVTWDSPLFGLLSGLVLEDHGRTVTVHHPWTEREATIPRTWLTRGTP
jgi:hypothetical protein